MRIRSLNFNVQRSIVGTFTIPGWTEIRSKYLKIIGHTRVTGSWINLAILLDSY